MKLEIIKPIKATTVKGRVPLKKGDTAEFEKSVAEVLVRKKFAKEVAEREYELNVQKTCAKIKEAGSLEDLKPFEDDGRVTVINALEEKKKELGEQ